MAGKKTLTLGKLVSLPIKLNFIHYNNHIAHMFRKVIAHPRYFIGGHRPSETSILTILNTLTFILFQYKVFISRGHRLTLPQCNIILYQYKVLVKVHGVFPSRCSAQAFSPSIRVHQIVVGDSGAVVTPFMQDGTYPPMNFATFGPSELQPPFTLA